MIELRKGETCAQFAMRAGKEYDRALVIASLYVHADARFVGLDRVRGPVAETAAANALGGDFIPSTCRRPDIAGTERDAMLREWLAAVTAHVKAQLEEKP